MPGPKIGSDRHSVSRRHALRADLTARSIYVLKPLGILVAQFKYRGKTRWFSRLNSLSSWDAPTVAAVGRDDVPAFSSARSFLSWPASGRRKGDGYSQRWDPSVQSVKSPPASMVVEGRVGDRQLELHGPVVRRSRFFLALVTRDSAATRSYHELRFRK